MRRRDFIAAITGASAWPLAAPGQQASSMRRVGAFLAAAESDQQAQSMKAAFEQGLQKLGWVDGRNLRIDWRLGTGDAARNRALATELVGLRPDALFAGGTTMLASLQQTTRSIPIVFALVGDPVGGGFVASFARPGGNITGFMNGEPTLGGKKVELLKEAASQVSRIAFLWNPETAPYVAGQFQYAKIAGPTYSVQLIAARASQRIGDRTSHSHTCGRAERRSHCRGGRVYQHSCRADHRSNHPVPAAGNLPFHFNGRSGRADDVHKRFSG